MRIPGHIRRPADQDLNPRPPEYIAQDVQFLHFTFMIHNIFNTCKTMCVVEVYKMTNHRLGAYLCLRTNRTTILDVLKTITFAS